MQKNSRSPKVFIVTPVHNGIKHTLAYLKSIFKSQYRNFEVILVDDGSSDGSSEIISKEFPDVHIVKGDGNLWWSGATNLGVAKAIESRAEYIFTVNNDVTVEPDFLTNLVKVSQKNPNALIGCKINYLKKPNKVWYFGAYIDRDIADINIINGKDSEFKGVTNSEVLTGMGVLIPVKVFSRIGLYDVKHLPQYMADSDFSMRASKAGFKLLVNASSKIYSDVDSSWVNNELSNPKLRFIPRSLFTKRSPYAISVRFIFYRRHWGNMYILQLLKFYYFLTVRFFILTFGKAYAKKQIGIIKKLLHV